MANLVHGFIYFSTEAREEYADLGLTGRQQYFAGRAAAMGPVGPELVVATFFNFNPRVIHEALPAAWDIASAEAVQRARMRAAERVLDALADTMSEQSLGEAIEIAEAIVEGVGYEGKLLAAANSSVELPDHRLLRLWQLATVIREWRGDAHVAALTTAPVSGIEALVLHSATGQVPQTVLRATRAWSEQDWRQAIEALGARGLVADDGGFTSAGRKLRDSIERRTNAAMAPLVGVVGEPAIERLIELLKPLRQGLLDSGIFSKPLGGAEG